MGKKTSSKTEKETWIEEAIFGLGPHHKTTISDGDKKVEGRGSTSEKSQKVASDKWDKANDSGSDSSSSSGGCFLTTACIEYAGLPDDCTELQTMRQFRDQYIRTLPDADRLLSDYYRLAPIIIARIKSQPDSQTIFQHLLVALKEAVTLIQSGRRTEALALCMREFSILRDKYGCQ